MTFWTPFFWKVPGNALSFAMRRLIRWERGLAPLKGEGIPENLAGLFSDRNRLDAKALEIRARELILRYSLEKFRPSAKRRVFLENLYLLDALDSFLKKQSLPQRPSDTQWKALDIGTGPWEYAPALMGFFSHWRGARPIQLTGLEVDGHLLYPNFRSRADYARAYADVAQKLAPDHSQTSIRFEDFLVAETDPQDLITLFYPFILPHQILAWGLPYRFLKPQEFLTKALFKLNPGGRLLAFLHAQEEREPFEGYIRKAGGTILHSASIESKMTPDYDDLSERRGYWIARAE
jgi:SAM-dependent methyltransferase